MTEYKYTINDIEHTLVFNPTGRPRYSIDGKAATGVTTILGAIAKPALVDWAAKMAYQDCLDNDYPAVAIGTILKDKTYAHKKKSDSAKDVGTAAHADVEKYIRWKMGETTSFTPNPETTHMVQPFIDWAEGRVTVKPKTYQYDKNSVEIVPKNITFLRAEQSVFSLKYKYAGTFDFLCEIDGKKYICDFKTSSGIYGREYFYQTAAYRNAIGELGWGTDVEGSIIIRSGKEGNDLEVKQSLSYTQDFVSFMAAYVLYHEGFVSDETTNELNASAASLTKTKE